jgi:hypothetical protein
MDGQPSLFLFILKHFARWIVEYEVFGFKVAKYDREQYSVFHHPQHFTTYSRTPTAAML